MARPTWSLNVFEQQFGRCFDISSNKQPIIFDLVDNLATAGNQIFPIPKAEAYGTGNFDPKETVDLAESFDTIDYLESPRELTVKLDLKLKNILSKNQLPQLTDKEKVDFILEDLRNKRSKK